MQQFSLLAPQLLIPAPVDWQLGGGALHEPPTQTGAVPLHVVPACHWPVGPHDSGVLPLQVDWPGPHTPVQPPPEHVVLAPHDDDEAS